MFFVAEELREIMADLGFRTDGRHGRPDCDVLEFADLSNHWKAKNVDLFADSAPAPCHADRRRRDPQHPGHQDHGLQRVARQHQKLIPLARGGAEDRRQRPSTGRAADHQHQPDRRGTTLAGMVAKQYGATPVCPTTRSHFKLQRPGRAELRLHSLARGMTVPELEGDANDYVGKGLCGGQNRRLPAGQASTFKPSDQYHRRQHDACTVRLKGELYLRGVAGERFAVRNSGAKTRSSKASAITAAST